MVILAEQRSKRTPVVLRKEEQWTRRSYKLSSSAQETIAKLVEQPRKRAWRYITEN